MEKNETPMIASYTSKYSRLARKSKHGVRSMMCHALVILLGGLILWGCAGSAQVQQEGENAEPSVLGWVDRAILDQPQHAGFRVSYDTARVQQEIVELLRQASSAADWLVFFGSWCGDSRREVGKFLKVADMAGIPGERIRLYGLDRTKRSPDGLAEQYQIERVPTFIALSNGEEVGRITETPQVSMEADMLSILARSR